MKKTIIFLCLILPLSTGTGGERPASEWSSGSAYTMPEGRMEIGLFHPLRYSYSKTMEFSMHPVAAFVIPNFTVKRGHGLVRGLVVSTRHSFIYPTPLLRLISREGTGGIISPEFDIPHMISLNNEVLISKMFAPELLLTIKAGCVVALRTGDLDERTTIDLPIVYHRLLVFYHNWTLKSGLDLQGRLFDRWSYVFDSHVYITPPSESGFCFENKGLILWTKSSRFALCFGYKLVYAEYPFGTQWHLLGPLFDLKWAWKLK